jgi:hypothetical protein
MVASTSSRGTTELANFNAINCSAGRQSVFKRRAKPLRAKTGKPAVQAGLAAYAVAASDEDAFSFQMDEPVFAFRRQGRAGDQAGDRTRLEVLPTLNGLDPAGDVWKEVCYAGVAIRQTAYTPDKPIAVKQAGKAKLLNTGTKEIPAGAWVELYVMGTAEATRFKAHFGTSRVMAGLREAGSAGPSVSTLATVFRREAESFLRCAAAHQKHEAEAASLKLDMKPDDSPENKLRYKQALSELGRKKPGEGPSVETSMNKILTELLRAVDPTRSLPGTNASPQPHIENHLKTEEGQALLERASFTPNPVIGRALHAIPRNMFGTLLLSEMATM